MQAPSQLSQPLEELLLRNTTNTTPRTTHYNLRCTYTVEQCKYAEIIQLVSAATVWMTCYVSPCLSTQMIQSFFPNKKFPSLLYDVFRKPIYQTLYLLCRCCCLVTKSSPTLWWLCGPLSVPVLGTSRARILKWVTIFFSRGSSQPRD